jgi:hypothetical protein
MRKFYAVCIAAILALPLKSQFCSYANLLANPGAESGVTGWTFTNGGNGWSIPTNSAYAYQGQRYFQASYSWCIKTQTIDLLASGYSRTYLNTQPAIVVKENYIGGGPNFADDYYLKVLLKDSMNNVLATYNYGSTSTPAIANTSWQQAGTTFTNYGSGVKYVVFESGGKDVEFWAGNYGTLIDGAEVKVLSGSYILKNGDAQAGLTGWNFTNGGNGWAVTTGNNAIGTSFVSSYIWCTKSQTIDLYALGYKTDELDLQPRIYVRESYEAIPSGGQNNDDYYLRVELRNGSGTAIATYTLGSQGSPVAALPYQWQLAQNTFSNYGTGLRYIYFESGGRDRGGWAGQYGTEIDEAFVGVEKKYPGYASVNIGPDINAICYNSVLNAGAGYQSYLWNTAAITQTTSITAPGYYWVQTVDNNLCLTSDSVNVQTVNPLPTVSIASQTVCAGNTITFDPGTGYASYSWSPGGATTQSITVSNPGNYTVGVTDNNGCSNKASASATFNPAVILNLGADQTVCAGTSVSFNAGTGYSSYSWNTGATTTTISATSPGMYICTVTNSSGCSGKDTVQLINWSNPIVFSPLAEVCSNQAPFALNATPGGGTFGGIGVSGGNFTPSTFPSGGSSVITYSYTDGHGCPFISQQTQVVSTPPANATTISGSTTVCAGAGGVMYAAAPVSGATSYNWTVPAGVTITGNATNDTIYVDFATSAGTGNFQVYGSNACAVGGNSSALLVTVNPLPGLPSAITGSTSVCAGTNGIAYSVNTIANATAYTWSLPAGISIATGNNTNSITSNFNSSAQSGYIYISGTNACGNGLADSVLVTVNPLPDSAGVIDGINSITVCPPQHNIMYSVLPIANAANYIWTLPMGAAFVGNPDNDTITVNFSSTVLSGTITVQGSNTCGTGVISSIPIALLTTPVTPICMVTVDSTSTNNIIYWDKTGYSGVDSFIVYREVSSNTYLRIGAVSFDSLSQFVDVNRSVGPANGDPNVGSYRYKLQTLDTCGNYSQLSPYHNTIYIIDNQNGTFSWPSLYTIEGVSGPVVNNYVLMRDNNNTNNYVPAASIAGTQNVITDPQYATYQMQANWYVETQWSISCTPTQRINPNSTLGTIVKSKSNIANNRTTGIALTNTSVQVYPVPAGDVLTIVVPPAAQTTLIINDLLGNQVYAATLCNESSRQISLEKFAKGVYLLQVSNESGKFVKRIIKE